MTEKNLTCPECGQIIRCQVPDEATEEELMKIAFHSCDCTVNKIETDDWQMLCAKQSIEELCGKDAADGALEPLSDDVIKLLYRIVELMALSDIAGATIKTSGNGKITFSVGSKCEIKINRTHTTTESRTASSTY